MTTDILYSRKFSSAKNFVKSDCQAVGQEFIFVNVACRSGLLYGRSVVTLSLSFIFPFMDISDPTIVVCEKISQEFNLVKKNCFDESDEINS